jgi:hypothetical protein
MLLPCSRLCESMSQNGRQDWPSDYLPTIPSWDSTADPTRARLPRSPGDRVEGAPLREFSMRTWAVSEAALLAPWRPTWSQADRTTSR